MKIQFAIFFVLLWSFSAFSKTCDYKRIYLTNKYDSQTNQNFTEMAYAVNRPLNELKKVIDPQNWARCSNFWKESYLVDESGQPLLTPPFPGTSYEGVLFENVGINIKNFGLMRLKVLLNIKSHADLPASDDDVYRIEYSMNRSIDHTFLGRHGTGGTVIDEGAITISPLSDGRWKVVGYKISRFDILSGKVPPYIMNPAMGKGLQIAAYKFAKDLVCCELPEVTNLVQK